MASRSDRRLPARNASIAATSYSGGIALLAIAELYFCAAVVFPALRPAGNVSRADAKAFVRTPCPFRHVRG
jgi:hypothetical protein